MNTAFLFIFSQKLLFLLKLLESQNQSLLINLIYQYNQFLFKKEKKITWHFYGALEKSESL